MDNSLYLFDAAKIELHYWLEDNSHKMNAITFNKCEKELIGIIFEVAKTFNISVDIEVEPLQEGGLRSWLNISAKKIGTENYSQVSVRKLIIITCVVAVLTAPITSSISEILTQTISSVFEDKELKRLEKENLQLQNENLKLENAKLRTECEDEANKINENLIKKKRSNYYSSLEKEKKVIKLSASIENDNNEVIGESQTVQRHHFNNYIITNDDIEPEIYENAVIELVAPILKKGKYKWLGIFNDEVITFGMKSNEFKTMVQTGQIEFKNGFSIDCLLQINKKIDSEGLEKISSYEVNRINSYLTSEHPTETPEGKKYRKKKEANNLQGNLFN